MIIYLLLTHFFFYAAGTCNFTISKVIPDNTKSINDKSTDLHIFEIIPLNSNIKNSWKVGTLKVDGLSVDEFNFYIGDNSTHVKSQCKSELSNFGVYNYAYDYLKRITFGEKVHGPYLNFDPLYSCSVGVKLLQGPKVYSVIVSYQVNWFLVIMTLFGMGLFIVSFELADSIYFHFTFGVLVSLCGATVLVAFILSRFIPFRKTLFAVSVLGNSIIFSIIVQMKEQLWSYALKNLTIVAIYVVVVTFMTILVMYYNYPDNVNRKTINIIDILLKATSTLIIFFSVNSLQTFFILIALLILPLGRIISFKSCIQKWWVCKFPPKRHLISPNEYPEILKKNTSRELNSLREYLTSPQFNTWGAVSMLKSINRLADFVKDGSQFSELEMGDYYSIAGDNSSNDSDSSIDFIPDA